MSTTLISYLILLVLSVIWGSSFILMKLGMFHSSGELIFSPIQVASIRMLIASSIFLPISFKYWKLIKSKTDAISLIIVALCGSFIPSFLFTIAEKEINSGLAGMLNSFTPIFTVIIGSLLFSKKTGPRELIGIIIGSFGVTLLTFYGNGGLSIANTNSIFLVILATFCYAISLSTIKYKLNHLSSISITSLSLSFIWPAALCIALFSDSIEVFKSNEYAFEGFIFVFILAIFSTTLATLLFNFLIKISSALFASSVTYIMPIVAVLWGLYFNEQIYLIQVAAVVIILIGVFVTNSNFKKTK